MDWVIILLMDRYIVTEIIWHIILYTVILCNLTISLELKCSAHVYNFIRYTYKYNYTKELYLVS